MEKQHPIEKATAILLLVEQCQQDKIGDGNTINRISELLQQPLPPTPELKELIEQQNLSQIASRFYTDYGAIKEKNSSTVYHHRLVETLSNLAEKFYLAGQSSMKQPIPTDEQILEKAQEYMSTIGNKDASAMYDFMKGAEWMRDTLTSQGETKRTEEKLCGIHPCMKKATHKLDTKSEFWVCDEHNLQY